jgi:hypothetical protein
MANYSNVTPLRHSSLSLFKRGATYVEFAGGIFEKIQTTNSTDGPTVEFNFASETNVYIDPNHIFLHLQVKIVKKDGTDLEWHASDKTKQDNVIFTNNTLHSLFSNVTVYANDVQVWSANGLYAQKAYIETEWSHSAACKKSFVSCQGYEYAPTPEDFAAFTTRLEQTKKSAVVHFYGPLAIDLFSCEGLFVSGTRFRIRMDRADSALALLSNQTVKQYMTVITEAELTIRRVELVQEYHDTIMRSLAGGDVVQYEYIESIPKSFMVQKDSKTFMQSNIFNNLPIRRITFAITENSKVSGVLDHTPFDFQKFDLAKIEIQRPGIPLIQIDTTDDNEAYYTTLKALKWGHGGPDITREDYPRHYIFSFDLTTMQDANNMIVQPDLLGKSINLKLDFKTAATSVLEVHVIGEILNTLTIDGDKNVFKESDG